MFHYAASLDHVSDSISSSILHLGYGMHDAGRQMPSTQQVRTRSFVQAEIIEEDD
jgi:hypothetical protein